MNKYEWAQEKKVERLNLVNALSKKEYEKKVKLAEETRELMSEADKKFRASMKADPINERFFPEQLFPDYYKLYSEFDYPIALPPIEREIEDEWIYSDECTQMLKEIEDDKDNS